MLGASGFAVYVNTLRPKAAALGVSRKTFDRAFDGVTPDESILPLLENQPEHDTAVWDYLDRVVSEVRVARGREMLAANSGLFDAIETLTGVERAIIAAIWGIETTFGSNTGERNVIRSLATLGWRGGRRARYGETQLLAALQILQRGDITAEAMTGSWAGAMGHTQFIPTTFNAYAVDFDRDGRRDIWSSLADALASTANYLSHSGWNPAEPWGYEVQLPGRFDYALVGLENSLTIAEWSRLGVARIDRARFERPGMKASLLLPAGARGPAFLVTRNFRAILRYNNAVSYALAVVKLADQLKGLPPIIAPWPRAERALTAAERAELQSLLAARGYPVGQADGIIGARTKAAVRGFQAASGLPADGFPTVGLLERLRRSGGT
jgi:membrane-bound lytic murein transglycosylase B